MPEAPMPSIEPPVGFELLYEEGPCLVVNKPAGLPTQAPWHIESLETRIKNWFRKRLDRTEGKIYLGVPHRLDRPTSGALVFARHVRAARKLSTQFQRRHIQKIYWCCVAGHLAEESGIWEDFVYKLPDQAHVEVVDESHEKGRHAVLHYRRLAQFEWGDWLEIKLKTGRTHQIRVQMASRGHPILGDAQYGSTFEFGPQHDDPRQRAIGLHARRLAFEHPMTGEPVEVTAPVSPAWLELGIKDE
jgi:23S rRNA pseudouridine1911/1915/1917 synthase